MRTHVADFEAERERAFDVNRIVEIVIWSRPEVTSLLAHYTQRRHGHLSFFPRYM